MRRRGAYCVCLRFHVGSSVEGDRRHGRDMDVGRYKRLRSGEYQHMERPQATCRAWMVGAVWWGWRSWVQRERSVTRHRSGNIRCSESKKVLRVERIAILSVRGSIAIVCLLFCMPCAQSSAKFDACEEFNGMVSGGRNFEKGDN